ncbi:hypothetical protein AMECASPLE_038120 [Ameca splendens]|uniref:Uncharacterized protein n=1 Tax=Ameca splendens TaxID=208324 RepID=A0ABV0XL58_9TELE
MPFQDNSTTKRRPIMAKEICKIYVHLTTAPHHPKMSYYYRAKRCRVNKLMRETEQEILTEYKLITRLCLESTDLVAAFSECLLDLPMTSDLPLDLPTTSDLSLNRPLTISDRSENIELPSESDAHFESITEDEEIEPSTCLRQ